LTDRVEKIDDASELSQVRRQARRVEIKAVLAGLLLTVVALVLPSPG